MSTAIAMKLDRLENALCGLVYSTYDWLANRFGSHRQTSNDCLTEEKNQVDPSRLLFPELLNMPSNPDQVFTL